MTRRIRAGLAVVAVLAAVALQACGGGGNATKAGSFVGRVEGTDAFIALVSDGTKVGGYVCDGNRVSTWFEVADISGGKASLATRDGQALGEATLSGDTATGTVSISGADHAFAAQLATGDAGLYRAVKGKAGQPGSVEVGWIVLGDGSQRGGTNFIDPNSQPAVPKPAPTLDTSATTVNVAGAGALSIAQVTGPNGIRWLEGILSY